MQRAYARLETKALEETADAYVIRGIASTPRTDRMGDVVEPLGATYDALPKLFLHHDTKLPIGNVSNAKPTIKGIPFEARMPKVIEPGVVQDRVNEAVHSIKYDLLSYVSIGFQPKVTEPTKTGYRFVEWDWMELSVVGVPANPDAVITGIKSIDDELHAARLKTKSLDTESRAASGHTRGVVARLSSPPGASGKTTLETPKGKAMATFNEQIASFEAKRAANVARMDELLAESSKEGCTLDQAQQEEHDNLEVEVKSIDGHLTRLRAAAERMKSTAKPVTPEAGTNPEVAVKVRAGEGVLRVNSNLPKGRTFTRYAMTLLRAKGDSYKALELAKQYRDTTPEVEEMVKSAVAAGNTTDSAWALPLAVTQPTNEFVELLYPMTILGKLNGVQRVPFNVSMPRQTAGSVSQWVGEDNPKPVSRLSLETISLGRSKIATIVVLSEELVQDSSPSAEAVVQADMLKSVAAYSDAQFIDPTVTASGTVRPASITNGLTTHNMTGTAVSNVLTDMQTLMSGYITANIPFDGAAWVMHPRTALYLSMLLSSLGTPQFPNINVAGGTFLGFPVVTSTSVPIDTGADTYIILMDAGSVLLADDGIKIDVSREASLQMDSAPTDAAASQVSLWQNNLVGLRCERRICYRRRRDAAVQVLSAVSY